MEGRDPRRRQGFGRRTEGPGLSSASIWGPLVSPAGICVLTPGRGGCQREMPFSTKLSRCLLCWFALFIYFQSGNNREKERKRKKRSKTSVDMEEPFRTGAWRTLGRLGGGWETCPPGTLWGVLPDLLSGVGLLADPSLQTLAIYQGRKPLGFPATVTQTPQASRLRPENSHEASSKRSSGSHYLPLRRVPPPRNRGLVGNTADPVGRTSLCCH